MLINHVSLCTREYAYVVKISSIYRTLISVIKYRIRDLQYISGREKKRKK